MTKRTGPRAKFRKDVEDPYRNYALREARVKAGLGLYGLSELTGVSWQALASYERLYCSPTKRKARRIAETLEVPVEDIFSDSTRQLVILAREARREEQSTGEQLGSNLHDLAKNLKKHRGYLLYFPYQNEEDNNGLREATREALDELNFREREIIQLRHGFYGMKLTLKEIGEKFGLSRSGVLQIQIKAIAKLRRSLSRYLQ